MRIFSIKAFEVLRNFKLLTKIEDKAEGGCLFRAENHNDLLTSLRF